MMDMTAHSATLVFLGLWAQDTCTRRISDFRLPFISERGRKKPFPFRRAGSSIEHSLVADPDGNREERWPPMSM